MTQFLLPCECGRKHPVTTAQAGDQLACECGRTVDVPTLRHLTALERVEEEKSQAATSWGARQGLVFLGAAIVLLAVVGLVLLQVNEPKKIDDPIAVVRIDKMTPAQVWNVWPMLSVGIMRQLLPIEAATLAQNKFEIDAWREWRLAAFIAGGIGFAVIAGGLLLPARRRRPMVAKGMKAEG